MSSSGPPSPRPFLRWAGSKQRLIGQLLARVPQSFGRYYEPFLGSGALFFALNPKRATLSDASLELIETWRSVRDHADGLCEYLRPLKPSKDLFYRIRENRSPIYPTRAGEFIYLNKTCWNGLYRVNARGEFNVPYASLPGGCMKMIEGSASYYYCGGGEWYRLVGKQYRAVARP